MLGRFCKMKCRPKSTRATLLDHFTDAVDGLRQGLIPFQIIGAERDQSGEAGESGGPATKGVVVVPIQVDVGIDKPGQNVFALSIDVPVSRRQQMLRGQGYNFFALDSNRRVDNLGRSDHLPAADYGVYSNFSHRNPSRRLFLPCDPDVGVFGRGVGPSSVP